MTDLERDAIDYNYPTYGDIIKLVRCYHHIDDQLQEFIVHLCLLCGWPVTETFEKIYE